jgi:heme-degrading monooxygenase HmoA
VEKNKKRILIPIWERRENVKDWKKSKNAGINE